MKTRFDRNKINIIYDDASKPKAVNIVFGRPPPPSPLAEAGCAIRLEAVARARRLVQDKNYPSACVLGAVAGRFVDQFKLFCGHA